MTAYANRSEGNDYFALRLYTVAWDTASDENKDKALAQSTRIIDRLRFAGEKHASHIVRQALTLRSDFEVRLSKDQETAILAAGLTQELEFPRGDDTVVPNDIKIACYEISYALLDGKDPDQEFEDQKVMSQGYSSVRTSYDRAAQEHTNSGIPSPTAWRYLKPYLKGQHGVTLIRTS